MASQTPTESAGIFGDVEASVLALFDELQQLQLELALLKSQRSHHASGVGPPPAAEQDLGGGQTRLLEAKATLALRNSVVDSAVALQPTLRAVHNATHASPAERDLLPNIEHRDTAAIKAAAVCSDLHAARARLAALEVESLSQSCRNKNLASEVLQFAGKIGHADSGTRTGGQYEQEIAKLETQMKSSYHRWKVMKGVAGAVVAGSSVDWVRDERLRNLVLDPPS